METIQRTKGGKTNRWEGRAFRSFLTISPEDRHSPHSDEVIAILEIILCISPPLCLEWPNSHSVRMLLIVVELLSGTKPSATVLLLNKPLLQ